MRRPNARFRHFADRQRLANIDDEPFLHDLINEASRSNTTFYPIDQAIDEILAEASAPDVPFEILVGCGEARTSTATVSEPPTRSRRRSCSTRSSATWAAALSSPMSMPAPRPCR
jgi:hypothetical protein